MLKHILYVFHFFTSTIAQNNRIKTDRVGQTNTVSTTPNIWIKAEIGFQKQTYKFQPSLKNLYFQSPSMLLKYGIGLN